jgi:hypothetical protein
VEAVLKELVDKWLEEEDIEDIAADVAMFRSYIF